MEFLWNRALGVNSHICIREVRVMVTCDYCGHAAELVTGDQVYPHRPDLAALRLWRCSPCDASVGVHKDGLNTPLGRLANAELRQWKMRAHAAFDPTWKSGKMTRHKAYQRLSQALNTPPERCHIGMFDVGMCKLVIAVSKEL